MCFIDKIWVESIIDQMKKFFLIKLVKLYLNAHSILNFPIWEYIYLKDMFIILVHPSKQSFFTTD